MKNSLRLTVSLLAATFACGTAFAQAPATKKAATETVYCAVTGEKIGAAKDASAKKTYNGKTYYICCPGCSPKFDAAPAKYAKLSDLRTEKRALEAKLSKINAELKSADAPAPMMHTTEAAPKHEEKTAVAASSVLHCAITDEDLASVKDAAGSEVYNGKTYYFCCPGCVTKFKASPAKYAVEADKRDAARAKN